MANPLDIDKNPEVLRDVEIVCKRLPGWGPAFRRLRERSGLAQHEVAAAVEIDRTSLSNWEQEKNYPQQDSLRKALGVIGIDARLLFRFFGMQLEGEKALEVLQAQLAPTQAALTLAQNLIQMADRTKSDVAEAITTLMDNRVLAATAIKALSDTMAAKLYFERSDKIADRRSDKRRFQEATNVTPSVFTQKECLELPEGEAQP